MSEKTTLLITGGAGFIGSSLVAEALKRDYRVVVLDKLTYAGHRANLDWIHGDHQLVIGDIADATRVAGIFKKFPIAGVIHAAARIGMSIIQSRARRPLCRPILLARMCC